MSNPFCSINSINRAEKIYGTATTAINYILIEYNRAWGKNPILESEIPETIKSFLFKEIENKVFSKIVLIKKSNNTSLNTINLFAINNREVNPFINHIIIDNYWDILNINISELFSNSTVINKSLYLVCTNGKKDKCCSKFGLPIYNQMSLILDNVWQCTHIGGDRFAPNVIHFPYSHFYGHLKLDTLHEFIQKTSENQIYIRSYRGRGCYNANAQIAEYYLRKFTNNFNFDSFILKAIDNVVSGMFSVKFTTEINIFNVLIDYKKSTENYYLTCNASIPSPINEYTLNKIVEEIS
ncbi:MAG TPA: sucrase ferredoxin [Ferruginibacter sp.]|nr:sucrase ferredoxin [Ferruginibacter sp.]